MPENSSFEDVYSKLQEVVQNLNEAHASEVAKRDDKISTLREENDSLKRKLQIVEQSTLASLLGSREADIIDPSNMKRRLEYVCKQIQDIVEAWDGTMATESLKTPKRKRKRADSEETVRQTRTPPNEEIIEGSPAEDAPKRKRKRANSEETVRQAETRPNEEVIEGSPAEDARSKRRKSPRIHKP